MSLAATLTGLMRISYQLQLPEMWSRETVLPCILATREMQDRTSAPRRAVEGAHLMHGGTPRPLVLALAAVVLAFLASGCAARLLARTFPLQERRTEISTGRLWVRRCSAVRSATSLDLDLDVEVLGWQWSGGDRWGFEVREYVYFSAAIKRASPPRSSPRPTA